MDDGRYLYQQNTPERLLKVWSIGGTVLFATSAFALAILFGDKSLSFTVEFSGNHAMDGYSALAFLALVFYITLLALVRLRLGKWITATQFYLPSAQVDDISLLKILDDPRVPLNFADLAVRQQGDFDIDFVTYADRVGDTTYKGQGFQFWLGQQNFISSIARDLDEQGIAFLQVFVRQVSALRPELTIAPAILQVVTPPPVTMSPLDTGKVPRP